MAIALRADDIVIAPAGGPVTVSYWTRTPPLPAAPAHESRVWDLRADALDDMNRLDSADVVEDLLLRLLFRRAQQLDQAFGATFRTAMKRTIAIGFGTDNVVRIT